ncbi:serine/threonine protein kinase [Dictyobacter kobayashii]|uniref:Protein kinase domain-containing protein n=1 Tax=Dictyobacter kobayashii TaxID=2014872 RepID=A0A402ABQ2_9CHLR|nr:serine/threonine-protein kinase [Dictyobacter kobayashii]GCE16532.1 hypothetical protein KDK_03320 [Dictyobacter kobayashii]
MATTIGSIHGKRLDHYTLVRALGRGLVNQVYLAWDHKGRQEVILKMPRADIIGGANIFACYRRELEVGKRLHHPGLQHLLYVDEARTGAYLVFEYLPGRPLRTLMHEHSHAILMPAEKIVPIMLSTCTILQYVHAQGIIHRDIKPENLLIDKDDGVKVLDFGISITKEEALQVRSWKTWFNFGDVMGTPAYMSPERLQGEPGDERSDVYALGIILYEALCGRIPFVDVDGFALTNRQLAYDPPDILRFNPALAPALAAVVMRAIRRDKERRYASVQEFAAALDNLDSIVPETYQPVRPLFGGAYRQALRIALLLLIIIAMIVGFGICTQLIHHASI